MLRRTSALRSYASRSVKIAKSHAVSLSFSNRMYEVTNPGTSSYPCPAVTFLSCSWFSGLTRVRATVPYIGFPLPAGTRRVP